MKLAYLAFSDKGYTLAQKLAAELGGTAYRSGQPQSLSEWTEEHFGIDEGLVFLQQVTQHVVDLHNVFLHGILCRLAKREFQHLVDE